MKNNLIPNDYSRCNNYLCQKRTICNRYLQLAVDKENSTTEPKSVTSFREIDCKEFIEHDDNN